METITLKNVEDSIRGVKEDIRIQVTSYADVSDGYHTIEELYDHRITLFIALCKMKQRYHTQVIEGGIDDKDPDIWRSKKHFDGSQWDGWFIMGIGKEKGHQITYHLPMSRWEETEFVITFNKAPAEFDGHTSADVLERLKRL